MGGDRDVSSHDWCNGATVFLGMLQWTSMRDGGTCSSAICGVVLRSYPGLANERCTFVRHEEYDKV